MAKKRNIALLGQVIKGIAVNRNWQGKLECHRLFSFWDQVVGKEIASHARPKLLRGSVLWVDVTDSVWMQQLHFQKTEILESINARLNGTAVNDMRFKLVHKLPQKPAKSCKSPVKSSILEPKPEEVLEFEKMISTISDEGVRESMKKLWLTQKSRTK